MCHDAVNVWWMAAIEGFPSLHCVTGTPGELVQRGLAALCSLAVIPGGLSQTPTTSRGSVGLYVRSRKPGFRWSRVHLLSYCSGLKADVMNRRHWQTWLANRRIVVASRALWTNDRTSSGNAWYNKQYAVGSLFVGNAWLGLAETSGRWFARGALTVCGFIWSSRSRVRHTMMPRCPTWMVYLSRLTFHLMLLSSAVISVGKLTLCIFL